MKILKYFQKISLFFLLQHGDFDYRAPPHKFRYKVISSLPPYGKLCSRLIHPLFPGPLYYTQWKIQLDNLPRHLIRPLFPGPKVGGLSGTYCSVLGGSFSGNKVSKVVPGSISNE